MNLLVVAVAAASLWFLERRTMRESRLWRATVTPLASIIGSGFLIVAPLLGFMVGRWAVLAVAAIVGLAYLVGGAERYNILHVEGSLEPAASNGRMEVLLRWLGRLAKLSLAFAYVIAITFYLELLGAFVLRLAGVGSDLLQKAIATALIVAIGGFGVWRGLHMLEALEKYAVSIKLAVIAALLAGLAAYNAELVVGGAWRLPALEPEWDMETLRKLLGAFLIVQGFETSSYLRGVYAREDRVRTMRYAQWTATAIYIAFVGLATVLLDIFEQVSETGIINLSERVSAVLPVMLIIGAVMSQFSAAVADTIGAGGLVEDATYGRVRRRQVYIAAMLLVLLLLWSVDIFTVVAYASRAFALYYAIHCAMAACHSLRHSGLRNRATTVSFALLSLVMTLTAVLAIPAGTAGGHDG